MNEHDRGTDGNAPFVLNGAEEWEGELAADHLLPDSERQQNLESQNSRWLFYFLAASLLWSLGSELPTGESTRVGEAEGDSTGDG